MASSQWTDSSSSPGAEATARLAAHIAGATIDALAPDTLHAFRRSLLDFLTCAIAGSAMPVSRALLGYFADTDPSHTATVIGHGTRLSAPNAAFVNGANTHALDFDDGHTNASAHPAGAVFPAVLALAEQLGARVDAADIALAAVVGYDAMLRIASAGHPATARRGFHNTALAGVFGATAGCARLLQLDARTTQHALGLAGSFAGGIREYLDEGAEVKRLHPGKAARDCIVCAELAARGITGPSRILEGRYGFFNTHADGEVDWDRLFTGLGTRWEIEDAYFKPYPCCRHYHSIVDGILSLRARHGFAPAAVERIDIGLYAVGVHGHDHHHYENLLDAQMSAPVAAALAVVDGSLAATSFLPDSLARADVQRLVALCNTRIDDDCERLYPGRRSGAVVLQVAGGATLESRVLDPKGEGENPLSDDDLEHKFRTNCEPVVGAAKCDRVLAVVRGFSRQTPLAELRRWQ